MRGSATIMIPPSSSASATRRTRWPKPRRCRKRMPALLPLYGIPVAVKDNIDAAGLPTTAACPAFSYLPAPRFNRGRQTARGRRHRHRQDQPRPVRHRPGRRALALWHPQQSDARRSHSGRIEFGFGGGGIGGTGAAGARHRHRGKRPGARDAQQYRRAEAEPRADLDIRRGAGLPDAGLRVDLLAQRRRRDDGAGGDGRT